MMSYFGLILAFDFLRVPSELLMTGTDRALAGWTGVLAETPVALIALVIATPIAWYSMQQWLQDFAYRIEINWWVFVLAGVAAVGIAIFSVSFQSVRAALANPVDSLRGE